MDDSIRDKTNQHTRNKTTAIGNMPNDMTLNELLSFSPKVQATLIPKYE